MFVKIYNREIFQIDNLKCHINTLSNMMWGYYNGTLWAKGGLYLRYKVIRGRQEHDIIHLVVDRAQRIVSANSGNVRGHATEWRCGARTPRTQRIGVVRTLPVQMMSLEDGFPVATVLAQMA